MILNHFYKIATKIQKLKTSKQKRYLCLEYFPVSPSRPPSMRRKVVWGGGKY